MVNLFLNVALINFIVNFLYDLYVKAGWGKSIWGYLITSKEGITFYGLLCAITVGILNALGLYISIIGSYMIIVTVEYCERIHQVEDLTKKKEEYHNNEDIHDLYHPGYKLFYYDYEI